MPPLARQFWNIHISGNEPDPSLARVVQSFFTAGWHYFDCSEVRAEASYLAHDLQHRQPFAKAEKLAFLPYPKLWIEVQQSDSNALERVVLAIRWTDQNFARVGVIAKRREDQSVVISDVCDLPLAASGKSMRDFIPTAEFVPGSRWPWQAYAFLAIINNPRIFERSEHEPPRRVMKQLRRAGDRNLHLERWTEIKLGNHLRAATLRGGDVNGRTEEVGGPRAQHYVRSHLRIRLGKFEIVSAHLRGDPNAGTVRSTYKAMPFANGGTVTYVD
jgi:hypothetical protein